MVLFRSSLQTILEAAVLIGIVCSFKLSLISSCILKAHSLCRKLFLNLYAIQVVKH